MGKDLPRLWLLILMVGAWLATAGLSEAVAQRPFSTSRRQQIYAPAARPDTGKPSFGDSISSSIKEGFGKLSNAVAPKPRVKPADDPISLATEAKPGAELHVAVARLYAESGKPAEAVGHYQKALQQAPDNLAALLGSAHLKDRLGQPAEARELYLRAARAHPNEAAVHNNLALFCAGRGMLNESGAAFTRAIQLQPKNPKYRNNFARLLVKMGRSREAFAQLRAAHRQSVAHYNLGYLLEEQGQKRAALEQFALALRADASLEPARRGLQRLSPPSTPPQPPGHSADSLTRLSGRPRATELPQNQVAPLPPSRSTLMRLPPTLPQRAAPPGPPPTRQESDRRQPVPAAPLPGGTAGGSALQHLPPLD